MMLDTSDFFFFNILIFFNSQWYDKDFFFLIHKYSFFLLAKVFITKQGWAVKITPDFNWWF